MQPCADGRLAQRDFGTRRAAPARHALAPARAADAVEVALLVGDAAAARRTEPDRAHRLDAHREEEAQALEEKRQAEVKKRQDKLIGKCTHARNGASVFTGPYPKKMCLICRIKLDPLSGLYVIMEKGAKA